MALLRLLAPGNAPAGGRSVLPAARCIAAALTSSYSHYSYGANVLPQPPNGVLNPNAMNAMSPVTPPGPSPPDENVVGINGTIW